VPRKPEKPTVSKTPAIDPNAIRELAKLLDETGLTEIEIETDGAFIRVARNLGFAAAPRTRAESMAAPGPTAIATGDIPVEPSKHPGLVSSPMVGTAYRGPAPGARPPGPRWPSRRRSCSGSTCGPGCPPTSTR